MNSDVLTKKDNIFVNNNTNDKANVINNNDLLERIDANLWITANAGSGKTTQLVNRYLLLLANGIKEDEIVCITYTEAGAKEMKERIIKKTREKNMKVNINILKDSITTIHGFCYKQLCKYNLISKNANILLENDNLMDQIIVKIVDYLSFDVEIEKDKNTTEQKNNEIIDSLNEKDKTQIDDALSILSYSQSIEDFNVLIRNIIQNQNKFLMLFNTLYQSNNIDDLLRNVDSTKLSGLISQDLQPFLDKKDELEQTRKELESRLKYYDLNVLYNVIGENILKSRSKNVFQAVERQMLHNVNGWRIVVFSSNGKRRKLDISKIDVNLQNLIQDIQDYFVDIESHKEAETTLSILHFAHIVLKLYQKIKEQFNVITYDDMLFLELQQLSRINFTPMLKDINKIKYLMLDEAQDTSPISWDIVKSLIKNTKCKFFVVGDKKQSIYSFQGAKIEEFEKNEKLFETISCNNKIVFNNKIKLNTSYRSIQKILDLADKLCNSNNQDIRSAFVVNYNNINIDDFKVFQEGDKRKKIATMQQKCVEPVKHNVCEKNKNIEVEERKIVYNIDFPDNEKTDIDIAQEDIEEKSATTENARCDKNWIKRIEHLANKDNNMKQLSYNIALQLSDYIKNVSCLSFNKENFAIIVPTTSAKNGIMMSIIDNLNKKFNICCKMKFDLEKRSLYFLDLMCFYKFAYLQNDDMNLACLLKSDFFCLTDNDLYEICASYEKHYWYNTLYDKLKSKVFACNDFGEKIKYACNILSIFENCDTITEITDCLEKIIKHYQQYLPIFEKIKNIVYREYEMAKNDDNFIFNYDILNFIEKMNKNIAIDEQQYYQDNELLNINGNEIFVSTIHGVKGMEFDNVILLDIQEQRHENAGKSSKINFFNNGFFYKISKFTIDNVFDMEGLKTDMEKYKMQIDSEKWRLLYVAITRAKKRFAYFGDIDKTKYGISFFSDFVESDY